MKIENQIENLIKIVAILVDYAAHTRILHSEYKLRSKLKASWATCHMSFENKFFQNFENSLSKVAANRFT